MKQDDYKTDYKLERWITAILALLFLIPFVARAEEPEPDLPAPVFASEIHQGSLLLKTNQQGLYIPAPILHTRVEMRVNGMILRARVIQQFQNPADRCVEGIYVFPLPETAAVDRLFMTIGDRRIEGQIKEKEEARRTYEQAKSEGRKASLLEQQRPNVFTISVASLLPGEQAQIEIEYQQVIDYRDGEFRLRFPTLVAPRYTPGAESRVPGAGLAPDPALGTGHPALQFPEHFPRFEEMRSPAEGLINPVSLQIELNSGVPLRKIESSSHRIATSDLGPGRYQVTLADGEIPANGDFELSWQPEIGQEPRAAVFTETVGGETYGLVMVVPPTEQAAPVRLPRETVYIIDTSGSMEGESMEQARDALVLALNGLEPGDTFNVIEFDSDAHALFPQSQPADPEQVARAIAWVRQLAADDGTEMLPAIAMALQTAQVTGGRVRQIIFITDGQVGNEQEIFEYINANLGNSRLFTVGIGSAPNSHFMRGAAQIGRGTMTYIGNVAEVKTRMGELFRKLDNPVLSDIRVHFEDPVAEAWPARVPDLYIGEPLMIAVKLTSTRGGVTVQGNVATGNLQATEKVSLRGWSDTLALSVEGRPPSAAHAEEGGIGKLWARRKIEALGDSVTVGADAQQVRGEIIKTALQHHLVSQYTSLVAVDVTPTGLDASRCISQLLPLNQPKGWRQNSNAMPGQLPQTATPAPFFLIVGLLLVVVGAVAWRVR